MGHTHRVKYEGHRKFVSGAAAAAELGVSGTTFSYLKHKGKLSGVEIHKISDSDYYGLKSVREFGKGYKPRQRDDVAETPKKRIRRTKAQIVADEAKKVVAETPDPQDLVAAIARLEGLILSTEAQVKHLYTLWK